MDYKDYYKSLGVSKTATLDEIKKQYRLLARQTHPDVNTTDKGASAKFAEISEAYEVLSDTEKRKKYDSLGSEWEQYQKSDQGANFDWNKYASPGGSQDQGSSPWGDAFGDGADMSEFFRNLFGGSRPGQPRRGSDLKAELTISLEEAYAGGVKRLSLGHESIRLTLKPGIGDHQTIKIPGKGSPGAPGAPVGDLYLTFLISPHPDYLLEGVDLYRTIPVSLYTAILGAPIEVATISGKFKVKVPPGTKDGVVFKLTGKGFPHHGKPGTHGDLYLKVRVELPENLTAEEKELFGQLAALRNKKVEGAPQ